MNTTKKSFLGVIMAVVMVFAFAAALIMPTTLTAHAGTREREIVAVDSGNSLHMSINDEGLLTWDTVANATGYGVSVMQNSATVSIFDTTNKALMIVTELDSLKLDSGRYVIEVYAKGVAKRASMSYYYTSNVDKLESPHGLQWIGNKAGWENVEGATSYRLWLYGFSGEEFSIVTNDNPYDLSAYSPQDGWTFKVQALGNGTLASKRDSAVVESPAKGSRTRTINAANSGNALNMAITNEGLLTWDAVENATGYRIAVKRNNLEVTFFETTYNFIALLSSLDGAKLASGQYVLEVAPQGVAANSASMSYYYTSNVDQLESPYNLHWNGTQACWTAVAGATLYDVTLYDFNGAVVTVPTEDDYYDFEGNSPEDGWTFKVQARSNGTLNAPRHSISQESPAKETTYSIYCVAPENGTVSLTTNKGSREDVTSAVLSATNGSEVTVSAVANPGYEFVAWRLNTPSDPAATCSTDATYTFDAMSEIHIFAVFTNEYTVTYNGNGGAGAEMQGSVVNVNNERNQTFTLGECTYTAPYGKEFKGWAVGSVDAFPLNEAGDTIEIHADTTIYAIWDNRYIIVEQPENTSGKIGANVPVTVTIDISQVPNDSNDNIVLEVQNGGNWEQVAATTRSAWVSEFHSSTGSFNVTANTTGTKTYRYKVYDGTEWFTSDTFDVEFLPLVVTFVDNEHSTETDPISVDEYNTLITAPVIPTFAGDTFGGWNWPNWDFANDRVTQDITLSAQWKGRGYYGNIPDVYALVGAKARIDLSNVYSNNSYTYVYKYDGANWVQYVAVTNYTWYDLDASAVAKSETYKIVIRHSEDIESNEFTVNWVEDAFTVSFNNNGGDGTMDNVEAVGVYKLPECEFDAPASHRFVGWAIGSADTLPLKEVGDQITISANTVIYVVWEEIPEYMVAYNDNGGQGSMIGDLVEEGGEFTLDPCGFEAPDGKQFAGWAVGSVDALPLQQPGAKITITANTFIYAIWENIPPVSTYTVSFEANGGANSMADVEDVSGDYVLPANGFTAPNGKQFKCWSVDGEEKAVGATIVVNKDTVVTAIWEEIPHECVGVLESGQGATCTVDGWKDYYRCECGKYYEDENCTILISDLEAWKVGDGKIVAAHSGTPEWTKTATTHTKKYTCCDTFVVETEAHEWNNGTCSECGYVCLHTSVAVTKKDGQAATCTVNGWKDYYQCACGKIYADAACTTPIADLEAWKVGEGKIVAEHTYGDLIPEDPAVHTQTELKAGMRAHYHCSVCDTYFDSSKNETTAIALTIPAPTHSFGDWIKDNEKHWKVCSCGLKADEHTHNYTDNADMICNDCGYDRTVPHTCGNGTKQDGQGATCTVNGWKDYYKCACGKIYADAACTNEITSLEEWKNGDGKITASHSYGDLVAKVDATCSQAGMEAHYECSVCHTLFDENKAVKTENELTIDIDVNAHTYGAWTSNGDGTHSRVCGINGNHKETVACSGGTATCTEKAVCEVCNTPYGNTVAHSHGSEWKTDANNHWNECACGDKANTAPHADEDNDGKCDTCDYEMGNAENPGENIEPEKTGLSGGAIAGIAVGSVAVVGLGGFSLFWFVIKKKKFADLIALFKKK